jgi:hypothetical protein
MQPVLSFEQAPPISVPYRFFLTAPLSARKKSDGKCEYGITGLPSVFCLPRMRFQAAIFCSSGSRPRYRCHGAKSDASDTRPLADAVAAARIDSRAARTGAFAR